MGRALRRVAAVVGPTASGKTSLAVQFARAGLPVEVINCDASQMVKGLDAATAKPSPQELDAIPHHLIDVIEVHESMDAARYVRLADQAIEEVSARGHWPLLVGGTGLYHRALVEGLAPLPSSDPTVRRALELQALSEGMQAMHDHLSSVDPEYAAITPANNRQRVLRALEVHAISGRAFSDFHRAHRAQGPRYQCLNVVLDPPHTTHGLALAARAEAMVPSLIEEVEGLLAAGVDPTAPGMQALGYRQTAQQLLDHALDRAALTEALTTQHRRYAKRQRTWFRRLEGAHRLQEAVAHEELIVALREWFQGLS